jgi:thioredoxin 1
MPLKVVSYTQKGCMACTEQSPINREVEKNVPVVIEEVDALKDPSSIKQYQLKVTPTTLVIKDGIVRARFEGVVHREQLEEAIRKYL